MASSGASHLSIAQPPATLRDVVQEKMRSAIIAGHFEPGERLVERALCDQLGVSRTVIRETIRYLEAEGLVTTVANRGPIVARMTWDDTRQIYDIRKLLETSAAQACAGRTDAAFEKSLRKALRRLGDAYSKGGSDTLLAATSDLYKLIFDRAGHDIAWETVQRLNGRISRLRAMTLASVDRHKSGFAHMQSICDAILSGDPDATRTAVHAHIDDARAIAKRALHDGGAVQNDN
jgi:DNA-binding GntR family transcriptional regulator